MTAVRHAIVLLIAGLLVGGCGAHRLSQAQDAFSKAAEQENRLVAPQSAASVSYASPVSLYLQADRILTKDTQDRASELKTDGLLATAYALHALTLWRLTDLSTLVPVVDTEAERAAADAKAAGAPKERTAGDEKEAKDADARYANAVGAKDATDGSVKYRQRARAARLNALADDLKAQLGPRDRVMMAVLPGLMDHDTGLQHLARRDWKRAHGFFASAFAEVARASPPPNHDIRAYLAMVQIQTLVAWHNAVINGLDDGAMKQCRAGWFIPQLKAAIDALDAAAKHSAIHFAEGVWESPFIRSRLEAVGVNVDRVKNDRTAVSPCAWK